MFSEKSQNICNIKIIECIVLLGLNELFEIHLWDCYAWILRNSPEHLPQSWHLTKPSETIFEKKRKYKNRDSSPFKTWSQWHYHGSCDNFRKINHMQMYIRSIYSMHLNFYWSHAERYEKIWWLFNQRQSYFSYKVIHPSKLYL